MAQFKQWLSIPQAEVQASLKQGVVFVQSFEKGFWDLHGLPILGAKDDDHFSYYISLASRGNQVAVGSPQTNDTGYAQALLQDGVDKLVQRGQTLFGEESSYQFGYHVETSSDGDRLTILSQNRDSGDFSYVITFQPVQ